MAGIIDGNGHFAISKEGNVTLEITNHAASERCLQEIKQVYGGSVKPRSGCKAVRYRIQNRAGLVRIISDLSGEIRTTNRVEQYKAVCKKYDIEYKEPKVLTMKNG